MVHRTARKRNCGRKDSREVGFFIYITIGIPFFKKRFICMLRNGA